MRAEPQSTLVGNGSDETSCGVAPEAPELAAKHPEGVSMVEKLQEHIYIIPLRDVKRTPRWKRANTAIKDIRRYLEKHMKSDEVKLDRSINERVWERGSQKPPSRIRIRAMKLEDGQVQAELAEE